MASRPSLGTAGSGSKRADESRRNFAVMSLGNTLLKTEAEQASAWVQQQLATAQSRYGSAALMDTMRSLDALRVNGERYGEAKWEGGRLRLSTGASVQAVAEQSLLETLKTQLQRGGHTTEALMATFRNLDADGSGVISRDELRLGLSTRGVQLTTAELDELIKTFDTNSVGGIMYQDFVSRMMQLLVSDADTTSIDADAAEAAVLRIAAALTVDGRSPVKDALMKEFLSFDTDRSGKISQDELQRGLAAIGVTISDADLTILMKRFSAGTNSSEISYDQFVDHILAVCSRKSKHAAAAAAKPSDPTKLMKGESALLKRLAAAVPSAPELMALFKELDTNNSGSLAPAELKRGIEKMGVRLTDAELQILVKRFDANRDGLVSWQEFCNQMRKLSEANKKVDAAERRLQDVWKHILSTSGLPPLSALQAQFKDAARGNTSVNSAQLTLALKKWGVTLSPIEAKLLFTRLDRNGDGTVSFDEFAAAVQAANSTGSFYTGDWAKWPLSTAAAGAAPPKVAEDAEAALLQRVLNTVGAASDKIATVFAQMDTDRSGQLSRDELRRGLANCGVQLSDNEFQLLWRRLDKDGSQTVSLQEFADHVHVVLRKETAAANAEEVLKRVFSAIQSASRLPGPEAVKAQFLQMDRNRSGNLTADEVRQGLAQWGITLSADETLTLVNHIDRNKDGNVSIDEFMAHMARLLGWPAPAATSSAAASAAAPQAEAAEQALLDRVKRELGSQSQQDALARVFRDMDRNGSGKLSSKELGNALARMGITLDDRELQTLMRRFDTNNDGTVSYQEFISRLTSTQKRIERTEEAQRQIESIISRMVNHRGLPGPDAMQQVFRNIDVSGSGTLTKAELSRALSGWGFSLTPEELDLLFARFDRDGSGSITYREFVSQLCGTAGGPLPQEHLRAVVAAVQSQAPALMSVLRASAGGAAGDVFITAGQLHDATYRLGLNLALGDIHGLYRELGLPAMEVVPASEVFFRLNALAARFGISAPVAFGTGMPMSATGTPGRGFVGGPPAPLPQDVPTLHYMCKQLQEENAALRRELAGLDLSFFEEVEDLKFRYEAVCKYLSMLRQELNRMGVVSSVPVPSGMGTAWGIPGATAPAAGMGAAPDYWGGTRTAPMAQATTTIPVTSYQPPNFGFEDRLSTGKRLAQTFGRSSMDMPTRLGDTWDAVAASNTADIHGRQSWQWRTSAAAPAPAPAAAHPTASMPPGATGSLFGAPLDLNSSFSLPPSRYPPAYPGSSGFNDSLGMSLGGNLNGLGPSSLFPEPRFTTDAAPSRSVSFQPTPTPVPIGTFDGSAQTKVSAAADGLTLAQVKEVLRAKLKRLAVGPSMKRQFDAMDRDHSGYLSRSEFDQALQKVNVDLAPREMEALLDEVDRNRDGRVSFAEFERFIEGTTSAPTAAAIQSSVSSGAASIGFPLATSAEFKIRQKLREVLRAECLRKGSPHVSPTDIANAVRGMFAAFPGGNATSDVATIAIMDFETALLAKGLDLSERQVASLVAGLELNRGGRVDIRAFERFITEVDTADFKRTRAEAHNGDQKSETGSLAGSSSSRATTPVSKPRSLETALLNALKDRMQTAKRELDLRRAFAYLDKSRQGSISQADLWTRCVDLLLVDESSTADKDAVREVHQSIQGASSRSPDAVISFAEFTRWALPMNTVLKGALDRIRLAVLQASKSGGGQFDFARAFNKFDRDRSGTLSLSEVKAGLRNVRGVTDQDLSAVFAHLDRDGTGSIEYKEWLLLVGGSARQYEVS